MLHQIHAKRIVGQEDAARKRMAAALAVSLDAENLGTYWAQIPGSGR